MSPLCNCCGEQVNKLNQQVSVMRKEIKNLRHLLDSGVRAHRKHMASLQSAVSKVRQGGTEERQTPTQTERTPTQTDRTPAALERGSVQTVPIGFISSCFSVKNGTPRQPTVCGPSRASLRVLQSVFTNPEHALLGLEHYSHVWVIFLFHKNGHLSYKAKVKPPRLNGQRVGVYSTRSPHRPNAVGLTLARLDGIVGDTVHLSEIDMIDGTPVLDIKPYIPDYDDPQARADVMDVGPGDRDRPKGPAASPDQVTNTLNLQEDPEVPNLQEDPEDPNLQEDLEDPNHEGDAPTDLEVERRDPPRRDAGLLNPASSSMTSAASTAHVRSAFHRDLQAVLEDVEAYVAQGDALRPGDSQGSGRASDPSRPPVLAESLEDSARPCYGEEAYSTIAGWIREPPVGSLEVRFTPHAERELGEFLPPHAPGGGSGPRFRFLRGPEEAVSALRGVLSADPRSVYRRTRCQDRLFFFTLDTANVTCWFGPGFAEVLRVRPVGHAST